MKGSPAVAYVPFYDKRNGNPLSVIVAVSIEGVQAVIIQDEINNAESFIQAFENDILAT